MLAGCKWPTVWSRLACTLACTFLLCLCRSMSAALSRFRVCRAWGQTWWPWASTTAQRPWWYSACSPCPESSCERVFYDVYSTVDPFWLSAVDTCPRGRWVLSVGGRGGTVWAAYNGCHSRLEDPDDVGHEPQQHQHHWQIGGEDASLCVWLFLRSKLSPKNHPPIQTSSFASTLS